MGCALAPAGQWGGAVTVAPPVLADWRDGAASELTRLCAGILAVCYPLSLERVSTVPCPPSRRFGMSNESLHIQ